jgi:hypothetical protein
MPENYVLLERIELNATTTSITFANIPQTGYTDLKVVFSARMSNAINVVDDVVVSLNGSTASFSMRRLFGSGSGTASDTGGGNLNWVSQSPNAAATANTFGNAEFYIPNYTSSNNKSISADSVSENNGTAAYAFMGALLRSNTAAITSIGLAGYSSNFLANSTFSLYGIAAVGTTPAIAPKAYGGNIIDFDGTYWIHTFLTSGTFTPQVGLTCDYLVIAGGAGGGSYAGGGGGAGGYKTASGYSLVSSTNYTVTVGAGGTGNTGIAGSNGSNSVFDTITSTGGGGGGGSAFNTNGVAGGSGGGAVASNGGSGTGGAASPSGQGNAGGSTSNGGLGAAAGGGGAGAVGGSSISSTVAGNGGAGLASSITGTSVTRAGGGGGAADPQSGGTGGSGGGGNGGLTAPTAGTINTGSGGGGRWNPSAAGAAGGSGIVIIRYPAA